MCFGSNIKNNKTVLDNVAYFLFCSKYNFQEIEKYSINSK